jgi:uncharacterized Zn finger protein
MEALERFTDPARLGRGRSYANNGKVLDWAIEPGRVRATVRGSVNPYFGVYKEPRYTITITIPPIDAARWGTIIQAIGGRADHVTRLLLGEMPDDIEGPFEACGVHLLPHRQTPFATKCSCPDWANPCKHVAGVYYVLAGALDRDPFLMFALRGLAREALLAKLAETPLGAALAAELAEEPAAPRAEVSLYPALVLEPLGAEPVPVAGWWEPSIYLPPEPAPVAAPGVAALTIKREGDYPAFWPREGSFVEVMEDLYGRVRKRLG